ncbi:uncharacterized protein LACBIDRAFT_306413 [Laccaria bicolor S238N-H82]|uniref:Predicted protein n=1 Tax=Laccaria bicolor (strain S238N-H82 / ATCC MYA-4686) TaxID=486041 RepID=B0DMV1_LACBS|nr:uncharacterized protein LACBIDRAFT_306413 [Laccaria bicolor S238N-H82]EDR04035.1 predicted protein [Laccaria bicolor S238N-H82]|eukprot:XP_001885290.1 predicted protein [Laccaria bicolor S238N-H82]
MVTTECTGRNTAPIEAIKHCDIRYSLIPAIFVVFESPVRSGFLMPRGVNRNRNRSAFSPEVKRPDRTTKRPQTAVFCSL